MNPEWYRDFFQGVMVDLWEQAVPPEQTLAEVEFLLAELRLPPGGRVLDVPCGFGRHAVELAARGFHVTGVDVSSDCVGRARKLAATRGVALTLIEAEMREAPVDPPFDGAACLGNSFGYLDYDGTRTFLGRLAQALRPGARLVIETGIVAEAILPNFEKSSEWQLGEMTFRDDRTYHVAQSCLESANTITRGGQSTVQSDYSFVYTLAEIHRLLAGAGFCVLSCYESTDRKPFELGSRGLYLVAERLTA